MDSKFLSLYGKANAFEIFPVKRFLEKGYYFNYESPKDPYFFEIDKEEAIDINSEVEFKQASYLWKAKQDDK